ncbi:type II toxin-antitoxin system RelE/ParE family toxin [Luteimonas sp. MC1825]|uniref:type II toxin-antitoxin system RelE/ParE family toxin n=1 Tax=Luteimonas sp. MC1825 TaxID=2761107 RepID=UPI0016228127|nr:type II toxin-antitoxin system RelE/ParE family toxin [Luteimonas sp. MC1825]MBB6598075.1 type II toxin-antitoxin system RelE/ParE family toxin [Luteimonas sp. MC1825]QOC88311.1 type II toxin-antitoxin system RelE/ParE family toxin [Luteimonas sp. MC1825]
MAPPSKERLPRWSAALGTALLHLVVLLLAMQAPPLAVPPAEGSPDGGGALQVTWIDALLPSPAPLPPARPPSANASPTPSPTPARVTPPPVPQGEDPPPPAPSTPLASAPAEAPPAPAEPPAQRPTRAYGLPPGMRAEDMTPASAGPPRSPTVHRRRGNAASGPTSSFEVDGYQVQYEPLGEARLREWREQGMTELFLPLPGTRRLMVCPLEIVVRRGSGPCRMVAPDAPELAAIGDARQVILMHRVYHRGDEVWSGPGPYR